MFAFSYLTALLFCLFSSQDVVATNHGPLGNRNLHHRHHFAHHPTTLTASSFATPSTPSISRFITSIRRTTVPTSLVLRTEAPDETESDNDSLDESDTNASNPSDVDSSSEVPARNEITQPIMKTSGASLTPNGIKAGIAGGDAYPFFKDHIGWWYDWYDSYSFHFPQL